jgi:NitT/TauT family transport system substrate-binding protein
MRFLPRPAQVPMVGGLFMTAKRDFLAKNRPLVVAYGRSMAMATEFILANPNAAAAAYLKKYPEAAPRGVSAQDAIAQTVKSVRKRITLYRPPYAGGRTGQIFESEWREEAKLAGLSIPDVRPLFTQELTDEINAFDKAPIIAAAKAYKA